MASFPFPRNRSAIPGSTPCGWGGSGRWSAWAWRRRQRRAHGGLTCCWIAQDEGLILRDIGIVGPRKSFCLVLFVVDGADERLNLRTPQKAAHIVVVAHEIGRKFPGLLLLAELCRNRLEFFHQSEAGIVAGHALCAIVDDLHFVGRIFVRPGA